MKYMDDLPINKKLKPQLGKQKRETREAERQRELERHTSYSLLSCPSQ
jgi:hypothetical protein